MDLSQKNFLFGKILMTSFQVICGLDLPQSKILGTSMNWRSPKKKFWRRFFFLGEHLRLCPWSLALASSIPVLGLERFCPRKGCPWPWPRIFFVSLALASSIVSSTPPLVFTAGRVFSSDPAWISEKDAVIIMTVKTRKFRARPAISPPETEET